MSDIEEQMTELTSAIRDLARVRAESAPDAKAQDGGRYAAALDASKATADALVAADRARGEEQAKAQKAEIEALVAEHVKAALLNVREPGIARQVGTGAAAEDAASRFFADNASPALKASLGSGYQSGQLLLSIATLGSGSFDPDGYARAKATLDGFGLQWMGVPQSSKATLGTTGATGGYVLPNNLVASLVKPATQEAVYTGANPLLTVITGVAVRGVDQPYRTGAPARMTFQNWGATKENVDEAYGSYTATLGTIARIYDIGKQYLRFSAGSAEQDVMDELSKAAALAENYYAMAGAGTGASTPGVNDPTVGIYTALAADAPTYSYAHTAAVGTIAGSAAAALAGGFGKLAERSRHPDAVVVDATSYWTMFSQGSDSAGFWMSELLGAGFRVGANGDLMWRGVPILYDANLGTNTTTKIAIAGEFKACKFYRGMEFRVDSTDVAGDRWDKNLVGFRGEEEIGINAHTAVAVGAFELITGLIP